MSDDLAPVLRRAKIRFIAPSFRHVKAAADIIGPDIAEMARRINHPKGRKGYRARGMESQIGIHRFPKETITVSLEKSENGRNIITAHEVGPVRITITVDKTVVIKAPFGGNLEEYPEAYKASLAGSPVSKVIDFSETSIPELGNYTVKRIYVNNSEYGYDGTQQQILTIYAQGDVYEYDAEVLATEMARLTAE